MKEDWNPLSARRLSHFAVVALGLSMVGLAGCAGTLRNAADQQVEDILAGKEQQVLDRRRDTFVSPQPVDGDETAALADREAAIDVPEIITLRDALRLATRYNRNYIARAEGLYLSALGLTGTRFQFGPQFNATVGYLASDATGRDRIYSQDANLSASQILPTGGTLTLGVNADFTEDGSLADNFLTSSTGTATLTQPLLRGAGYEVAWEGLTQAERSVVYDVREFSRFREQFLIDVTRRFYDLVAQSQVLDNTNRRFEDAEYQMKRTTALFEVGRQGQIEVLRSKNDMLRVEDDLLDAQQTYDLTIDQFKVFLGLPTSVDLNIAEETPQFIAVDVSLNSAIAAAMANRYDLVNAREQLEDTERGLRIAHDNLLPDLDLTVSGSTSSDSTDNFRDQNFRTRSNSVGLSLEIPLQRTQERNALRRAQIGLDQQRRGFEEFRDNIVVEVRESLRDLRSQATSLRIQEQIIAVEERRVRKARIDFAAGDIGNRDVVEAERSLLDARNARINQLVNYEILRIRLERVMGTLHVEPDGTWHALRSPAMAAMETDEGAE